MRIVTGMISHETSTFTTVPTTWESFGERFGFMRGAAVLELYRGTNTPTGGFIEGAATHGFELVPTVAAQALPSGPAPRHVFDRILDEMLQRMAEARPFDGVLLELHGSMVAEGIDDADGFILSAVRDLVGPQIPIVVQLDIHANVSPLMVEQASVLIGRETYPEVDMAERGRECAGVLVRILKREIRPTMALCQVPMVWGLNQFTARSPMQEAIAELHEIEARPQVVCGSIATCYWLADVPEMGASVYIVTNDDRELAQKYADELGAWIFERRAAWLIHLPSTQEALAAADEAGKYPAIFADPNDNPGGGAPGDSTGMLRTFIEAGLWDACLLYIVDPAAVRQCQQAGVGATLALDVGAKTSPAQGKPVRMQAKVMALSEGHFRFEGPMYAGLAGDMGPSAYIRQEGVHVILVTSRELALDTAFAYSLGLDPKRMRYIGIKGTGHFRAAFEPWAGNIFLVSEPGVHDSNVGNLVYHKLGRQVYPIDAI